MKINEISKVARGYGTWDDAYDRIDGEDKTWFEDNSSDWIPANTGVKGYSLIQTLWNPSLRFH